MQIAMTWLLCWSYKAVVEEVTNMKTKSKRKILIIVLSVVIVLLIVGDWALSVIIYNENFNQRFESDEAFIRRVDDFDGSDR